MSTRVMLSEKTLNALEELQKHDEGFFELVKSMEEYLINDDHLYEDSERCVEMVLLLKTFRYYSGIIVKLLEKGGTHEE